MTIVIAILFLLGLVFLAREASLTDGLRARIHGRAGSSNKALRWCRTIRFVDRMLECAPCVAAWMAPPAAGIAWGLPLLHPYVAAPVFLLLVSPVCGIGALYAITALSPTQALAAFLEARRGSKK
jgi:hypothetical protein